MGVDHVIMLLKVLSEQDTKVQTSTQLLILLSMYLVNKKTISEKKGEKLFSGLCYQTLRVRELSRPYLGS